MMKQIYWVNNINMLTRSSVPFAYNKTLCWLLITNDSEFEYHLFGDTMIVFDSTNNDDKTVQMNECVMVFPDIYDTMIRHIGCIDNLTKDYLLDHFQKTITYEATHPSHHYYDGKVSKIFIHTEKFVMGQTLEYYGHLFGVA